MYPNQEDRRALMHVFLGGHSSPVKLPNNVQEDIEQQLNQFRGQHMRAVSKFVPQAMDGTADESGGIAKVADYLKPKIIRKE